MIPSDHFVRYYNEVFRALDARGHAHLAQYWRQLGEMQKKELAESVVGTGEDWVTAMSTDQLRQVFALSREAVMEE